MRAMVSGRRMSGMYHVKPDERGTNTFMPVESFLHECYGYRNQQADEACRHDRNSHFAGLSESRFTPSPQAGPKLREGGCRDSNRVQAIYDVVEANGGFWISWMAQRILASDEWGIIEQSGACSVAERAKDVEDRVVKGVAFCRLALSIEERLGIVGYGPQGDIDPAAESFGA